MGLSFLTGTNGTSRHLVAANYLPQRHSRLCRATSCRWIVVVFSFLAHVVIFGISWTSGIFYDIFKHEFHSDSSLTSLMASLNTAILYGAGPLSGMLTNQFGHRNVSIVGGLLTMVGLFLSCLANDVNHLLVTFGIITGFGLGLSYVPFISIIGPHFDGSRFLTVALGLAACGTGIGTLVFPPLLRLLIREYTWRGALLITGAIGFNLCVFGALLRPVDEPDSTKNKTSRSAGGEQSCGRGGSCCRCRGFSDSVRFKVFRNWHYLALCLNNVFLCFGLSIVYVHLAAYAELIGCEAEGSAMLYSVVGAANFGGRVIFGALATRRWIGALWCYQLSLALCGVATCLCPLADDYTGLALYSAFFGFLSASIGPLLPKIMIDFLDTSSLASAYGYLLVFEAIGQLIGAPAAGWIYDYTHFYSSGFYLSGASLVFGSIVLIPSLKVYCFNESS